jgi:trehalose 6-phosphate synthase/phosphatase
LTDSFLEEKDYSIVLHYRKSDRKLSSSIIPELFDVLSDLTANTDLLVKNINNGLEVKNMYINKGLPVLYFLRKHYQFILSAGDDTIDEEMFEALPDNSISIKVGSGSTRAKYFVKDTREMLDLLERLSKR